MIIDVDQRGTPTDKFKFMSREAIAKQLENFKSGKRKSTAMAAMAEKLTPDEMVALGKYFEKKAAPAEPVKEEDLAGMGRYIFLHGNKFSGVPACARMGA